MASEVQELLLALRDAARKKGCLDFDDPMLLETMLKTKNWFQADDVMVGDRGYRDCLEFLAELGLNATLSAKRPEEHTTREGNESRNVTRVRLVIESANGRIKQWKAPSNRLQNVLISSVRDFVRIVCVLCNAFRPPLASSSNIDQVVAERMLTLCSKENPSQQRVQSEKLDQRRVIWKDIDESELEDFPMLNITELRHLTFGVYHIKQARSYMTEHLHDEGDYKILVHREHQDLIMAQIQSRYTPSKLHSLWIE